MAELRFEWDDRKGMANERRHGVSFEEAAAVFADEQGLLMEIRTMSMTKTDTPCSA